MVLLSCLAAAVGATKPASANGSGWDYASDAFGNPWDYNDAADIIVGDGPLLGVSNASVANGQFSFDTNRPSYISPLWGGYPGALTSALDGATRPVDTARYNRVAFKLTSSAPVDAGIRWYTCSDGGVSDSCQGGFAFDIKPGTQIYDFELKPAGLDPALDQPWSGKVTGFRLAFGNGSAHIDLDWMSIYGGTPPVDQSGPAPLVLNPDIEGGTSIGPILRSKEWDMTAPDDITRTYNVNGAVRDQAFSGTNSGPTINDPAIVLNLGCKTFDASQFHRFTVDFTFDGVFNVEDKPGGGMNQRLIWRIAGTPLSRDGTDLQNSEDIVIYPGRRRFSLDLTTSPAVAITDPAQSGPRVGWVGQIEHLRFDPNEDLGNRNWKVHSVKFAADDMVADGSSFDIQWKDANYAPGGVATVALSSSSDGSGATAIASDVAVQDGINTTKWKATGTGSRWVVLTITRNGRESRYVSTGPVTIGTLAPAVGINERGSDGTLANGDRCAGAASSAQQVASKSGATTAKAGTSAATGPKPASKLKPPPKKAAAKKVTKVPAQLNRS